MSCTSESIPQMSPSTSNKPVQKICAVCVDLERKGSEAVTGRRSRCGYYLPPTVSVPGMMALCDASFSAENLCKKREQATGVQAGSGASPLPLLPGSSAEH